MANMLVQKQHRSSCGHFQTQDLQMNHDHFKRQEGAISLLYSYLKYLSEALLISISVSMVSMLIMPNKQGQYIHLSISTHI